MTKKEKPRHLGMGLEALLGPTTQTAQPQAQNNSSAIPLRPEGIEPAKIEKNDSVREIALDAIVSNPWQPRTVWNDEELAELTQSIIENGIIQPIIVRSAGSGYEIVAGERRFRASKLAGLERIPAIVRKATDEQMLELALVENIHRANLNAIERAKAYRRYIDEFALTQQQASERLGENRSVIANHLRLLDLPHELRQMISDGRLSMGHARAILALPTDEMRNKLANRALAGRLSVREVERLVKRLAEDEIESKSAVKKAKSAHIQNLEMGLTRSLGTKVNIETKRTKDRGRIVIEFYSLDDFERITEILGYDAMEEV